MLSIMREWTARKKLPNIIAEVQRNLQVPEDESYFLFIKEDIKKQLPNRIDYYLKQYNSPSNQNHGQERNLNEEVINQLKIEIRNGVQAFISHLPEHVKGKSYRRKRRRISWCF